MKIYDWGGDIRDIKLRDKEIELIMITILSGDETGEVLYADGEEQFFDASPAGRIISYYDGSYIVPKKFVNQWLEYPDTHEGGRAEKRLDWIANLIEKWGRR